MTSKGIEQEQGINFYRVDLRRIHKDIRQELEVDKPDWTRVLAKAEDLLVLAGVAIKAEGGGGVSLKGLGGRKKTKDNHPKKRAMLMKRAMLTKWDVFLCPIILFAGGIISFLLGIFKTPADIYLLLILPVLTISSGLFLMVLAYKIRVKEQQRLKDEQPKL